MTPAKHTFTIASADGFVAERTSGKNYTHAVVASSLIPARVRRSTVLGIAANERHIARLEKALEAMDVVIVSRGLTTPGKDLSLEGKKSWTLYTAVLKGSGPMEDDRKALSTWCNSEGYCSPSEHVRDRLRMYAQNKLAALTEALVAGRAQLAELDAGTFDTGEPKVLRWAVGEKAARRAQASGLRSVRGHRDVDIISVHPVAHPVR